MKTLQTIGLFFLLVTSTLASDPVIGQAYLGVMFDPAPLPELLVKHLNLDPNQGLCVQNVHKEGPADRAGIARDDIIIGLDGKPVKDIHTFINHITQQAVGATIQLEVIQTGQRQTLTISLQARPSAFDPKYPPNPVHARHIQPGKVFHRPPGQDQWIEVRPDMSIPLPEGIQPFTQDQYVFHYDTKDKRCTVTILGDPHKPNTFVSIDTQNRHYKATVETLTQLPKDIRNQAQQAVGQAQKKARQESRNRAWEQHRQSLKEFWEKHAPEDMNDVAHDHLERAKQFFKDLDRSAGSPRPMVDEDRQRIDKLEKQLEALIRRLESLEKQNDDAPI